MTILAAENDQEAFYSAIDAFHEEIASIVDAESMVIYFFAEAFFQISPLTAYGKTSSQVKDILAAQDLMTDALMPQIEAVTPGGGAYMNEADFRQPRWQEEVFGENHERLGEVKRAWDPEGFFYALYGVGSEGWDVVADGRMCRAE